MLQRFRRHLGIRNVCCDYHFLHRWRRWQHWRRRFARLGNNRIEVLSPGVAILGVPVRRRLGLGVRREGSVVLRGEERVEPFFVLLPIATTTTTTTRGNPVFWVVVAEERVVVVVEARSQDAHKGRPGRRRQSVATAYGREPGIDECAASTTAAARRSLLDEGVEVSSVEDNDVVRERRHCWRLTCLRRLITVAGAGVALAAAAVGFVQELHRHWGV